MGVDLVGFGGWWLMGFEAVGVDLVGFGVVFIHQNINCLLKKYNMLLIRIAKP